ncbi:MAG: VWA domain-containing protein [Planctomycetota bacterium]
MPRLPIVLLTVLAATAVAWADLPRDVARAFKSDDPDVRLERLRAARSGIQESDRKTRNKAARAIEKALKKEPHPDVRMAAGDYLLALRTERSLDRLVAMVLDKNETVANHVDDIVRNHADPMLFQTIVRTLEQDESWRFRAAMVDLLVAGSRERGKPVLLRTLADKHPAVAARAAEGLERMTGQPLGLDAERWRAYFVEQAKAKPGVYRRTGETRSVADAHRKVKQYEGPLRGLHPRLYTVPIIRKRVIFVVDMSGSMSKGRRATHFSKLKRAIQGLPSDCHFNVLCFDQRLFFYTQAKSLAPATTRHKDRVSRWIDALPAGQKTDVNKSVVAGLAMLKEALAKDDKVKAELFILTDGRETTKTTSLRMVEAQYGRLPANRCAVHVVALGRGGTPLLKVLAQGSGGQFVQVDR